jgi:hypothetical protein
LDAIGFGFRGGINHELWVDDHAAVFGGFGGNALGGKGRTEYGDEGWCDVGAEGCADCKGTGVGHPIACNESQKGVRKIDM